MRNAFVIVLAIAVLACLGGACASTHHDPSQSSVRVTNPPGDGTSRIRGRVLSVDTGAPLRRALVLLQTPEGRSLKWVTTDAAGTYEFSDLASGTYAVKAQKDGFLSRRYGARESAGMGTAVSVGRAAAVEHVDIVLPPGGALAGRVLDALGKPVLLAFVGVGVQYRDLDGTERFVAVDGAVTDDLGQYRFWGLHPGKYYLLAEPPLPPAGVDDAHEARSAATYYPGVGSLTGAREVELAAGREASIEIVLQTVSPAHVSGTVLDESGRPLSGFTYVWCTDSRGFSEGGWPVRPGGTFKVEGLPPGEYTLTAFVPPGKGQAFGFGQTRVSVTGSDIDGIVIRAQGGAEVSGRVVFDGVSRPPMGTMRITAVPLEGRWFGSELSVGVTPRDGAFTLTPLFGDCLLGVEGIPPGWMLEGLYVNGKNVLGLPIAFRGGETITGARVVVTKRAASVKVTVQSEEVMYGPRDYRGARHHSEAYVVVYRDGPRRGAAHASPFHRTALPREAASTFDALPPGDYFAFAMSTQAAFGEFDADAVERLRALGTRFSIREGENKGITVAAIPAWGWSSDADVDHAFRSGAPARRGTGSLRGRVVDATSGAPLRDADVFISKDKGTAIWSTATDADGRYEFQDLPDGSYRVTAAKSGFDYLAYGERPPIRDETRVEVGGGWGVPVIDLALRRECALVGRVVDELGEPVSRAQVAIQRRYERDDGTPYALDEGATWTNDLGQFRIGALSAGQYFLVAELPTLVPDDVEDGERAKRVATYYPGTTEPAAAQPIRLAPGQTTEVTIELARPIRAVRISGRVVDAAGQSPRPAAGVGITPLELWSRAPGRLVPRRGDGTFTVEGVLPGAYALEVHLPAADGRPPEWGFARTDVAGSDISGIAIRTAPGATLAGRVVFEGASVPPAGTTSISVAETGEPSSGLSRLSVPVTSDGTFTLAPLFAECLIRVVAPPGWTLKAVRVNGQDVTDTPVMFDGRETITGAEIVLTDRVTHLDVSVQADTGQPADSAYVVVYPDDPGKWRLVESRYVRKAWVQEGTSVTIDALPPGDYFAFALTADAALEDTDESRLAVVERLRKTAARFSLREGERKALLLKPVGLDGK